jgi:hypothetical protein
LVAPGTLPLTKPPDDPKGGTMTSIHTPVIALGLIINHAEGVVIRTPVTAPLTQKRPEGVVRR